MKVVSFEKTTAPDAEVIALLKRLLAQAESGDILALWAVFETKTHFDSDYAIRDPLALKGFGIPALIDLEYDQD